MSKFVKIIMQMSTDSCKVCGNSANNKMHEIKEMQLGLREMFTYMECANCGLMQLKNIPDDLEKYYPNDGYYSFNLGLKVKQKPDVIRKLKASWLIYGKNKLAGSLLSVGYKMPDYYSWIRNTGVQYGDAILDVGTGNGSLLHSLYKIGFTNLHGIDPFIDENRNYGAIKIYRKDIFETSGEYDLVMLHHAFEHMDEPLKVLQQLFKLVKKGSYCLIRTPVMGNYSWKKYGVNWMDLDAPRHIIIHSLKSMELLAQKAGFELRKTIFDGNYMSLIGSDQYAKDIALPEANSYMVNKEASGYTEKDIANLKAINLQNNLDANADQAAFYLFKP